MSTPYGCSCRWVADKGQVEECATHKALREANARLTKEVEWWRDASDTGRIIRERDDAVEMHKTCHKERDEARAELARLERLILDADEAGYFGDIYAEARHIRDGHPHKRWRK